MRPVFTSHLKGVLIHTETESNTTPQRGRSRDDKKECLKLRQICLLQPVYMHNYCYLHTLSHMTKHPNVSLVAYNI